VAKRKWVHDPATHGVAKSMAMYERAKQVLPGAAATFSKSASQVALGVTPLFLERAKGARVWDVDGQEYIDYMMGLGPIILGHGEKRVTAAQVEQLRLGQAYSLTTPIEIETAELIAQLVPCAEMVRFAKNGSDVTTAAVKLARYATGRDLVAAGGYHGWHDWYVGSTDRAGGIPQAVRDLTRRFSQYDPADLERLFRAHPGQIAAVILEPAMHSKVPDRRVLLDIRDITHRHGAILIFDEVITGFRLHPRCAQGMLDVTPDLCTLGKALANGAPVSAIAGRRDLMEALGGPVFFSFTFGGEAVSLAAARATLQIIRDEPVCEHLARLGSRLRDGINDLASRHGLGEFVGAVGPGPILAVTFKDHPQAGDRAIKTFVIQELSRRGVLALGYHNLCYAHTERDIDLTLASYDQALALAAKYLMAGTLMERLEAPLVAPVFRPR